MKGVSFLRLAAVSVFAAGIAITGTSHAGVAEGKKIFDSKNCGACHQMAGPAKEKTIEDQLARKGPELWYAGSKFKNEFLEGWLKDPKPIRPMEYYSLTKKNTGNHPKLDAKSADEVSEYLMSLTSDAVKKAGIEPKGGPKGRIIFEKKQGCYGCHELTKGGNTVGGLTGPSFVGVADRLQPDWIYAYLANPNVFKPIKDMPVYVGILSEDEFKTLAEYVSSLK